MIYLLIILVALFQASFANLIAIANIKPDFLLIFVVFIALSKGPLKALMVGVVAGFLKDVLSVGSFLNVLAFGVCGVIVGLFAQRFYREKTFVQPLVVCGGSVFVSFLYLVWFSHWDYSPSIVMLVIRIGIPTVLYTALFTPPAFFLFKKLIGDAT